MVSRSGKHIAVRCQGSDFRVLELPSGKQVFSTSDPVSAYAFSDDGKWLATGSNTGDIQISALDGTGSEAIRWHASHARMDLLKFISSKLIVAGPSDEAGQIWDLTSAPVQKASLETDFSGLSAVAISPDGKRLVTASGDTVVRFYDATTWKKTSEYRELLLEPFAATFTQDGRLAAVGGADCQITLLDPQTGKAVKKMSAENDPVQAIETLDADHLAVLYIDEDGRKPPHLTVWSLSEAKSKPVDAKAFTGGGVANGKIWLTNADSGSLDLWAAE